VRKAFSPQELADLLGVSRATIYREMRRGNLQSVKVGNRRVITLADLENWLGKERARALITRDSLNTTLAELVDKHVAQGKDRTRAIMDATDELRQMAKDGKL